MKTPVSDTRVFVTGTAGFIGFHLAKTLLDEGLVVHGYDGMTDYYDVSLKEARHSLLSGYSNFSFTKAMLEDIKKLEQAVYDFSPSIFVHLAAQAGVRYSLENPHAYIQTNVAGTMNVLEVVRRLPPAHFLLASTSSVYGGNGIMPFDEMQKTDHQLTIYAATKKANESMSHTYSHLWELPTTVFRFFTVFGQWGRPDMALFKFVEAILENRPIDIYNEGEMYRDFTFIDDLIQAIRLLIDVPPLSVENRSVDTLIEGDSLSPVAPWRIVNIGNSKKIRLLDFVEAIEKELGKDAIRNFMPIQPGDVSATWADASLLSNLTGYRPSTDINKGVKEFVTWYRSYYKR